jgi:hypothetical protein
MAGNVGAPGAPGSVVTVEAGEYGPRAPSPFLAATRYQYVAFAETPVSPAAQQIEALMGTLAGGLNKEGEENGRCQQQHHHPAQWHQCGQPNNNTQTQ